MKKIISLLLFLRTFVMMGAGWFDKPIVTDAVPYIVAWEVAFKKQIQQMEKAQGTVGTAEGKEAVMLEGLKQQQEKVYTYFTELNEFGLVQQGIAINECVQIIKEIEHIYNQTEEKLKRIDPKMLQKGGNFYYLSCANQDLYGQLSYILAFVPSSNSEIKKNFLDSKEKNDIIASAKKALLEIRKNGYMIYRYACILEMLVDYYDITKWSNYFQLSKDGLNRIIQESVVMKK